MPDTSRPHKKWWIFPRKNNHSMSGELKKHRYGVFCHAQLQANNVMEDHSQVEKITDATFVGVYDGHGGPHASRFIRADLFPCLNRLVHGAFSEDILRTVFSTIEDRFLNYVRREHRMIPSIVRMGSCCLVGVIERGTLYVANVGNSRAVIGSLRTADEIVAEQLTRDHSANLEEIREELRALHPDDPEIVILEDGVWRVKGIIQVSRTIGDAYLKRPEFLQQSHHQPLRRPVLTAEPSIYTRVLQRNDKFLIFASKGLWEHLTNQEAADLVHRNPRNGVARRLLETALRKAAGRSGMPYERLENIDMGDRRHVHDDITVYVIFIDRV